MLRWNFPSRNNGDIEGVPILRWSGLRAVRSEHLHERYPCMIGMTSILKKCQVYWLEDGNEKTHNFLNKTLHDFSQGKIRVLSVMDRQLTVRSER